MKILLVVSKVSFKNKDSDGWIYRAIRTACAENPQRYGMEGWLYDAGNEDG